MTHSTINKASIHLTRSAFWDIDLDKLDLDRYADFTIIRVFERGTAEDVREIISYFGKEKTINTLIHATSLQSRAIALGTKIFGLSPTQFACYKPSPQVMNFSRY